MTAAYARAIADAIQAQADRRDARKNPRRVKAAQARRVRRAEERVA